MAPPRTARKKAHAEPPLPVDPERLRRQFPALTEEDLAAYVEVTRSVLRLPPAARAGRLREVMERAHAARGRQEQGEAVGTAEEVLVRYLCALAKVQGPTSRSGH